MWGDLQLLYFYPRNWQTCMLRTMHPWLLHMSLWQYWLWFTFFIAMSLYFIYVMKTVTYNRADIRGNRASGDKRRNSWSEMLIVLFPFFWSVNIVTNAFYYLRLLEGGGGYSFLSVQVSAYQWGWKYCYNDTTYLKMAVNPMNVGYNTTKVIGCSFPMTTRHVTDLVVTNPELTIFKGDPDALQRELPFLREDYEQRLWKPIDDTTKDFYADIYFCRWWLKTIGVIENESKNNIKNRLYQTGYWITAQGTDANLPLNDGTDDEPNYMFDSLRLFRSTGALVLPASLFLRLLSCSEDITHSWAVPGIGLKMDCVPGRLFCLFTTIQREGMYFGQCSELCGWNHYNMPIVVYALGIEQFIVWWELELNWYFHSKAPVSHEGLCFTTKDEADFSNYRLFNFKYK